MAVGKNKRISKGKKGGKKKASDPFAKKDWYDIKAPSLFQIKNIGKTLVSRTQGTKIASEGLKHRVFEVSLADLQNDEDHSYRKIKLRAEDFQGRNVLTNFWGMNFTTDKLRSLVRKAQTLIDAHVDVKTTDGYTLRMFSIGFTKKRANQQKRTCYTQSSQIRQIRRKMTEIMVNQASSCDLKDLVQKFIPESIGREMEKATAGIFPMQNVFIRKVKILTAPKFDLPKLMEVINGPIQFANPFRLTTMVGEGELGGGTTRRAGRRARHYSGVGSLAEGLREEVGEHGGLLGNGLD